MVGGLPWACGYFVLGFYFCMVCGSFAGWVVDIEILDCGNQYFDGRSRLRVEIQYHHLLSSHACQIPSNRLRAKSLFSMDAAVKSAPGKGVESTLTHSSS